MTNERDIPGSLSKDVRELLAEMAVLGWTFRPGKSRIICTPPFPPDFRPMSVSRAFTGRGKANTWAAFRRWKERYVPEERSLEAERMVRTSIAAGKAEEEGDEIAAAVLDAAAMKHTVAVVRDEHEAHEARRMVDRRPWMARKGSSRHGGGRKYESKAVIEREWSDGSVDYVCAYEGCNWNSDDPVSVARHYGGTHGAERPVGDTRPPTVFVPDYTETGRRNYRPSRRLVDAVLGVIANADGRLYPQWVEDPESLAEAILTWMHERPDLEEVARGPREPMSDEEILERIRALLGQPFAAQVETLSAQVADLSARLGRAEARATRLYEERKALAEMFQEDVLEEE